MIHRATSLLLNNLRTNKSPMRSGCRSSLSLATNCLRASRLGDDSNNQTMVISMYLYDRIPSARVRLPYVLFNQASKRVWAGEKEHRDDRRSIRSSTFDHLRHQCGDYIRKRGGKHFPRSDLFADIANFSNPQLYPYGFRIR